MMKSKFMAGLVATIISLLLVIGAAIFIVEALSPKAGDRLIKIIAFATIAVWLGLYSWVKPKVPVANNDQAGQTTESPQVSKEATPREERKDRNSYQ